jgi:hypothetical protein
MSSNGIYVLGQKNLDFFKKELSALLSNIAYQGKFVVISDEQLKGSYDSFEEALKFAASNFSPAEFIIQQVVNDSDRINFIRAAVI